MKLLSLHIDGFGKLADYRYDFSDGINTIEAENGFGKTTVAAFIKAMLYGMPTTTARSLNDNPRKHYCPWSKGAFGGTLDIETNKGSFRIARNFGKKGADDTFALTDISTGLVSNAYSENIGVELFGIDARSYEKSTYIPQHDVKIEMASDINAKLTGLLQSDDDMAVFDKAVDRIDDYIKRFKLLKGDSGLIKDTENKLNECAEKINCCEKAVHSVQQKRQELADLKESIKADEDRLNELNHMAEEASRQKDICKQYDMYCRSVDNGKNSLAKLLEEFPNGIPTNDEVNSISKSITMLETTEKDIAGFSRLEDEEYSNYVKMFGNSPLTAEDISAFANRLETVRNSEKVFGSETVPPEPVKEPEKKTKNVTAFRTVGIILAVLGIVSALFASVFFPMLFIGSAFALIGIILVIISFVNKYNYNHDAEVTYRQAYSDYIDAKTQHDVNRNNCIRLRNELESDLKKYYPTSYSGAEQLLDNLRRDTGRYESLNILKHTNDEINSNTRKKTDELTKEITAYFQKYGDKTNGDFRERFDHINEKVNRIGYENEQLHNHTEKLQDYCKEMNIGENGPVFPDTKSIEEEISVIRSRLDINRTMFGSLNTSVAVLENESEELTSLYEESEMLRQKIGSYNQKRADAVKAKEILTQAKDGLSSRYLRDMITGFNRNFNALTGRELQDTVIDTSLNLELREIGGTRDATWYSEGEKTVIAVCLRLALIDALYKEEKPFLILDDPFCELDGVRLEKARNMVISLANDRQIVYFTCHESRKMLK